jgi:para-nitrobenzyl esterase
MRSNRWVTNSLPAVIFAFLLSAEMPLCGSAPGPGSWENKAVVSTSNGAVRGSADKGSTWCWKGIPYAAPPVGPLRWKAPVDHNAWTGIRNAKKFGSAAAQLLPVLGPKGSEDCLYLNIWRPKGDETGLPVYLFIHGGGNSIGTGSSRDYYGIEVAGKSRMVYVSVNFRLGVLGWFRHPAVTGQGSPDDQSGNFGTLDLIKALQWVHDNISAFGGDPSNVTISGESGGAMDVLSLLISPKASGLFQRAVVESGLALIRTTAEAESQSAGLLANLLVADGKASDAVQAGQMAAKMTGPETDAYLRSKSPVELMKKIPTMVGGMANWPTVYSDGIVLPEDGYKVFASGAWANKVPLLIGVNKDEMKLFRFLLKNPAPGSGMYELLSRYQSLMWRARGLDDVAVAMASSPAMPPVYAYRFDWGSPDANGISVLPKKMGSIMGAHHYAEIPFFLGMGFNQLSILTGRTFSRENLPGRKKLTALCMSYLANFARTGNPNGADLPRWTPWDPLPGAVKLIVLDAGLTDLRLSSLQDIVTENSVIELVKTELKEPELSEVLGKLNGSSMFGAGK